MPSRYSFRTYTLRSRMVESLDNYVHRGLVPGGFLHAALRNDLMQTVRRADEDNLGNLPALAAYLYNEMPSESYGSTEKVEKWVERFRREQA